MKPKHSVLLLFFVLIITLLFQLKDNVLQKNKTLETDDISLKSINEQKIQNEMNDFIDPVIVKLPTLECNNYLQFYEVNETWQNINKSRLKELFISFVEKGLTGEELDHIASLIEISPSNVKALIGLYNTTDSSLPIIAGTDGSILPEEYVERVYIDLLDNKIDDIFLLIKQGVISGNTYIISKSGQYSLISSLLMNSKSLDETYNLIDQLINLNIDITNQDLMIATQLNLPLETLKKLWFASNLNGSFVLPLGENDKSLAQIALENKNTQLLDFWLYQGSASVIVPFERTLLDILPPPIKDAEKAIQTELFQILMKHNVSANNNNTRFKLEAWLEADIYSRYKDHLEQSIFMSIDIANRPQVGEAITDIFFTILQPLVKSKDSLIVQHPCFKPEALRVIHSVFKVTVTPLTLSNNNIKGMGESNLYSQKKFLTMDIHDSMAILGKDKTLEGKYAIVNFMSERIKYHLKLVSTKKYTENEIVEEDRELNLVDLAENGQWQRVMNELAKNKYSTEIIDFIMVYAVEQKQEIELILKIHSYNYSFSTAFMHAVVKRNDINLAIELVRHGLDFTKSNSLGSNAIYTAVSHRKMAMLRYLINEGINVKPYEFGLDPLDIALNNLEQDSSSLNFITILIDAGAPIEISHQEKVLEFSQTDLQLYLKITSTFPMLKRSLNS